MSYLQIIGRARVTQRMTKMIMIILHILGLSLQSPQSKKNILVIYSVWYYLDFRKTGARLRTFLDDRSELHEASQDDFNGFSPSNTVI